MKDWIDLGGDDLERYGMEVLVRVQARHRDGSVIPLVYHRIDPRCVSFTVGRPERDPYFSAYSSRMEINHYEDCRCGVQPLRRLRERQIPEDQESR